MSFQRRQLLQMLSYAFGTSFIFSTSKLIAAEQTPPSPAHPITPAKGAIGDAAASNMEKVDGIGGFFFRAHDPDAIGQWYLQHLGIALTPTKIDSPVWQEEGGPTLISPFPEKTKYFGDPSKMWMINFRVHNLDKLAAQLKASAIEVKVDPTTYPNGRFAHLHDPEGNPIELWQPA